MDDVTRTSTCRALLRTKELGDRATGELASRFGPRFAQQGTIVVLASLAVDGPQRPRQLQRRSPLTSGGLSNLLGRLEIDGLIARSPGRSGDDERAVIVALTDEGQRLEAAISETALRNVGTSTVLVKDLVATLSDLGAHAPSDPVPAATPPTASDPVPAATPPSASRLVLALAALGTVLVDSLLPAAVDAEPIDTTATLVLAAIAVLDLCRPGHLTELLGLTSGGVTRLLDRLQAAGLIERSYGPLSTDRRAVVVTLSPRGTAYLDDVLANTTTHLDDLLETVLQVKAELDLGAAGG